LATSVKVSIRPRATGGLSWLSSASMLADIASTCHGYGASASGSKRTGSAGQSPGRTSQRRLTTANRPTPEHEGNQKKHGRPGARRHVTAACHDVPRIVPPVGACTPSAHAGPSRHAAPRAAPRPDRPAARTGAGTPPSPQRSGPHDQQCSPTRHAQRSAPGAAAAPGSTPEARSALRPPLPGQTRSPIPSLACTCCARSAAALAP
jgi:hypothetical protein